MAAASAGFAGAAAAGAAAAMAQGFEDELLTLHFLLLRTQGGEAVLGVPDLLVHVFHRLDIGMADAEFRCVIETQNAVFRGSGGSGDSCESSTGHGYRNY